MKDGTVTDVFGELQREGPDTDSVTPGWVFDSRWRVRRFASDECKL